jgi:WXG100 family type VII secretion target
MSAFEVDVDELRAVVHAMTTQSATLGDLAAEVQAASTTLSAEWSGLARDAHVTAHARWAGDFVRMREALTELHTIGGTAADNYSAAVGANIAMWEQVR